MVRINVRGEHKIADKWEQAPWEVLQVRDDSPLIMVKNTRSGEFHDLHRNMLYPL